MNTATIWQLAKKTFKEWNEDNALRLGAALSYYTVFSIAPLLLITIGIAGVVYGSDVARERILGEVERMLGTQGAAAVTEILQHAKKPSSGVIATILGVFTLLIGASGVLGQLKDAMNTIWDVEVPKNGGIRGLIRDRLASFGMVLGIGFLLLVSLVISAALSAIASYWGTATILEILNFIVSIGVITVLFAMIFKFLPDTKVRWRNVWIGAFVTALLFTAGKTLTGIYIAKSSVASSFGAAGSLVIILVWVYYNSQVLFLGAEFTQVYSAYRKQKTPQEETSIMKEEKPQWIDQQPEPQWQAQNSLESMAHFLGYEEGRLERSGKEVRKKWVLFRRVYGIAKLIGFKTSAKLGWKGYKFKRKFQKAS